MKRHIIIILLFVLSKALLAQDSLQNDLNKEIPQVYIGIGSGFNNYCGLFGIGVNFFLDDKICFRVGAGVGTYGTKLTGGFKYEKRDKKGWGAGLSFSSCSGLNEYNFTNKNIATDTIVDFLRVNLINLTATYNFVFKNYNRFYIETGYSIRLTNDYYKAHNNVNLSEYQKFTVKLLKPGGLIIGIGFLFGL